MILPEQLNDGDRPSRLALARAATGETAPLGGPEALAFAAELQDAEASLAPFDWEILRAAAARVEDKPEAVAAAPAPPPWWRRLAWAFAPLAVVAAALALVVLPDAPSSRAKGDVDLDFVVLREGRVMPGVEGRVYGPGDLLQFTYRAAGHERLVLLSIDGEGRVTVFYPSAGDTPLAVVPGERHVLDGSIALDDAPGPELFVAVFGPSGVEEARELVEGAWSRGGAAAVSALKETDPAIDVVLVQKPERAP
ncbi:DUF4384 domain-containing protein [Myxococcota bacterium]|nr:DUF4384 domain-containing protein [Myxococcota bacterium]